ncbi:hypothetical protein SAY86_000414 [Trapa natans]|uniref:Hydroxyproline-rich glycoprotein family protein n=1 Tax=Trapa natans TaxID=22666 RepID=A0AAN7MEZ6_TRANT|nr:hypothetical protein SAY86_000414 [Trapa natans]
MWNSTGGRGGSGAASVNHITAMETVNAAAAAIAAAGSRAPQSDPIQKRRWGGWWSSYWCFGAQRDQTRIGHAAVIPETSLPRVHAPVAQSQINTTAIALPFIAPPSSPASFFQSEPPSVTQSPGYSFSITSVSAGMYSPVGEPHSIFAIGPYAHETQLVSPPVFSTFTTEPSTAPFTPPYESVHLMTTPSSPEVPFAQLLDPNPRNTEAFVGFPLSAYEFPCYQLSPGSPMGHLISPSSVFSVSGTSSPFPGRELPSIPPNFLDFLVNKPPKLLELEKQSGREWSSRPDSGSVTPDNATRPWSLEGSLGDCKVAPLPDLREEFQNDDAMVGNERASLEPLAEEVGGCTAAEPVSTGNVIIEESKWTESETPTCIADDEAPTDHDRIPRNRWYSSITMESEGEFNFNNKSSESGGGNKSKIGSASRTEEKVFNEVNGPANEWSFPVMQPAVS